MQTPDDTIIDATEATKAKLYSILTTKQEEITTIKETMGNTTIATCLETTIIQPLKDTNQYQTSIKTKRIEPH